MYCIIGAAPNSFGKTYGGTIYIYNGSDLNGADASSATPTDVLDLGGATADLCLSQTGANPVRPDAERRPQGVPGSA
jgi:hypothetical protein